MIMQAMYSLLLVAGAAHLAAASPHIPAAVAIPCKQVGGCCDFSGIWTNQPGGGIVYNFTQAAGSCAVQMPKCEAGDPATASGDTLTACSKFYNGLRGTLKPATPEDELKWANGAAWYRAVPTGAPPSLLQPVRPRQLTSVPAPNCFHLAVLQNLPSENGGRWVLCVVDGGTSYSSLLTRRCSRTVY